MGFEQIAQNYVTKISALMLKGFDRLEKARQKLQAGTYSADQLAADTAGTWLDALDTFTGVLPYVGSPVVPTIYMTLPAASPVGASVAQAAYLQDPVPPPANMSVTNLLQLGGAGSIAQNSIALAANGFELIVTFTVPGALTAGVYQAMIHMGSAPLALVVLELT